MKFTRRSFLASGAAALPFLGNSASAQSKTPEVSDDAFARAGSKPVLDRAAFKSPVIIESVPLLKKGRDHFVRVRSKDGAEGIAVDNGRADVLHPIFNKLIAPYFA